MKKLFISQPMKDKANDEILKEREKAIADIAYFAKGWDSARGCKIEHNCAVAYNIDVIENYE